MDMRKFLVVPMMAGALALGACGAEEEAGLEEGVGEGVGVVEEGIGEGVGVVEEGVGEGVEAVEGAAVGGTEILGNGIDDDGDGLIDEEA